MFYQSYQQCPYRETCDGTQKKLPNTYFSGELVVSSDCAMCNKHKARMQNEKKSKD